MIFRYILRAFRINSVRLSSLFCAVILITHSLVHFSVGEEKLIHTREDEL